MVDELTKLLLLIAAQGALGMAAVAGLRTMVKPNAALSLAMAGGVSLVICVAWELYLTSTGILSQWQALPIKVLVVWLISMGWWSGGKTAAGKS
jgi:hypothetical protein